MIADIAATHFHIGAASTENLRKNVGVVEIGKALIGREWPSLATIGEIAVILPLRALDALRIDLAAVETAALLRITQEIIGGGDILELLLGALVAGIEIGMKLLGKLAIGLLDIVGRSGLGDAQCLIGIGHGKSLTSFRHTDNAYPTRHGRP